MDVVEVSWCPSETKAFSAEDALDPVAFCDQAKASTPSERQTEVSWTLPQVF